MKFTFKHGLECPQYPLLVAYCDLRRETRSYVMEGILASTQIGGPGQM